MSGVFAREGLPKTHGFVSYSYEDRDAVQQLLQHLKPVASFELGISLWSDSAVTAGSRWAEEIATAIERADVFILCMSAAYLASEYVYYQELPAIRERGETSCALILPVILKPCSWWGFVGDRQVAPTKHGRVVPISEWRPQYNGYHAAADQIGEAMRQYFGLAKAKPEMPPTEHFRPSAPLESSAPSGPHRVSPDDIDRAVGKVISLRKARSGV
jgi:hypothetical protein